MKIKEFISKYSYLGSEGMDFTVDSIVNMVEDYLGIIYKGINPTDEEKLSTGGVFIQGMLYSAIFDQNNGTESEFDKFIIKNINEILTKLGMKYNTKNGIKLLE